MLLKNTNPIKITLAIALGLMLIVSLSTCKKYPEDDFAFRTVKQRLEGQWRIENIEINGENVNYKYNDSLPIPVTDFYFWFVYNKLAPNPNKDDTRDLFLINKSSKCYKDAYDNNDVAVSHFGLDDKKVSIALGIGASSIINDVQSSKIIENLFSTYTYRELAIIKKLYHKTLIIQKEKNNNVYRIYFKKT